MINQIHVLWASPDAKGEGPTDADDDDMRKALCYFKDKKYPGANVIDERITWDYDVGRDRMLFTIEQVLENA